MRTASALARTLSAVALAVPVASEAAESWFLMARHGECAPISSLSRKFPDLGAVTTPEGFVTFVRSKGLEVTAKPISLQGFTAHEVSVPDHGLALVFVPSRLCSSVGSR